MIVELRFTMHDLISCNRATCAEALLNHGSKNVMLNITEQGLTVCATRGCRFHVQHESLLLKSVVNRRPSVAHGLPTSERWRMLEEEPRNLALQKAP